MVGARACSQRLFVALALSMFGLFTVQMPAAIQTRLADVSNRQSSGSIGGVAVMGALSALIVTTCVGPALVGALVVISETGQMVRGGAALFAMSIGMGTPLLAVGASAGKLLPKAGPWMELVKKLFGVMMLAVAAWMLARITPERLTLLLWAVPALALAWLLWTQTRDALRPVGLALRAAAVARRCLRPGARRRRRAGRTATRWPRCPGRHNHSHELPFRPIASLADLDREVAQAQRAGQERAGRFLGRLVHLVQGDGALHLHRPGACRWPWRAPCCCAPMSPQNNADDQALLKHFGIFGPPTIAFYGARRPGARAVPRRRAT